MSTKLKYTILGTILGTLFPVLAWLLDITSNDLSLSFTTLQQIHLNNPAHFIADLAPLVLGAAFFFLGSSEQRNQDLSRSRHTHNKFGLDAADTTFSSTRTIFFAFVLTAGLLLVVVLSAWAFVENIQKNKYKETSAVLAELLHATNDNIDLFFQPAQVIAAVMSAEDEAIDISLQLLSEQNSRQVLRDSTAHLTFQSWVESGRHTNIDFFAILSADGNVLTTTAMSLASVNQSFSAPVGFWPQLSAHGYALCRPCGIGGEITHSDNSDLRSQGSVIVAHSILDNSGRMIAALIFQKSIFEDISTMLADRSFGDTGEIYAVNSLGHIISTVRFDDIGSSAPVARRLIQSRINPEHLIQNEDDEATTRDYRGTEVLLRHIWMDDLSFGLVAQVSADEIDSQIEPVRTATFFAVFLLVSLILVVTTALVKIFLTSGQTQYLTAKTKSQMQLIMNTAAEGIYGIDLSGLCTFANQACVEMTGYKNESDLLGKNMHELIHHSLRDKTPYSNEDCLIYKAFRKGRNVHVDNEVFWRLDGTFYDVEYHSNPIIDGQAITGAVVTFTDISKRKTKESVEKSTRHRLRKYRNALDELSRSATLVSLADEANVFFESVARILANAMDVQRVGIWRLTNNEQNLVSECLYDRDKDQTSKGMTLSRKSAPWYFETISEESISINDLRIDERSKDAYARYFEPLNIISIISAPFTVQAKPVGILTFAHTDRTRDWDIHDSQFAISAALSLAVATETLQKLATEHRQKNIVDTMVDGLITIDETGLIESFNPAAKTIFGYDEKEVIGNNITMLMDSPYRELHAKNIESYKKGAESRIVGKSSIEVEGLHKSGRHVPISISVSEMAYAGRRVFSGVIRDITVQKRLEQERKAAVADTRLIIDSANAPIFGVNKRLQVNEWNRFATELTGYGKDEVENCLFVDEFIHESDKRKVNAVLSAALTGTQTQSFEATLIASSGATLKLLLSAAPRYDIEGNISGVITIGQDISELKQKDAALQQAQKMEAVGQLTGGIAHDFNNLLSIIKGNLRFLQEDTREVQGIDELFDDALSAVDDGAELTHRLLAFSREDSLRPVSIDVCKSIYDQTRFLNRAIGAQHDLDVNVSSEQLFVEIDTSQLDNALLNLVNNSRDALPGRGTISITVLARDFNEDEVLQDMEPGSYVQISVADHGTGIAPKDLQHIFEPFFTTKSVVEGTGLGLSMVYGFVRQSGGVCRVDSKLGEGTTVSMYFPRIEIPATVSEHPDARDNKLAAANAIILVVEDDHRVRRTVMRDLTMMGYRTIESENADLAQDIIKSDTHIDLVFTDILMPGSLDGLALARWIDDNFDDLKVVLTSGYSDRKKGLDIDDRFPMLRKPYSLDGLSNIIRDNLSSN